MCTLWFVVFMQPIVLCECVDGDRGLVVQIKVHKKCFSISASRFGKRHRERVRKRERERQRTKERGSNGKSLSEENDVEMIYVTDSFHGILFFFFESVARPLQTSLHMKYAYIGSYVHRKDEQTTQIQ